MLRPGMNTRERDNVISAHGKAVSAEASLELGKLGAFVSALLMILSLVLALIDILGSASQANRPPDSIADNETARAVWYMRSDVIQKRWETRQTAAGLQVSLMVCLSFSLMGLLPGVYALRDRVATSASGMAMSNIFVPAFTAAAFLMLVEMLFEAGTTTVATRLSKMAIAAKGHDGGFGPIQSLELAYALNAYKTGFVLACDWFLLGVGLVTMSKLVSQTHGIRPEPTKFVRLGYVGGFLAAVAFVLDLASAELGGVKILAIGGGLFIAIFFLVLIAWTFLFARLLGNLVDDGQRQRLAGSESQQQINIEMSS